MTGEACELRVASEVQVHVVNPGDVLVLSFPDDADPEAINDSAADLHKRYGFPIIITDRTIRISIERRS